MSPAQTDAWRRLLPLLLVALIAIGLQLGGQGAFALFRYQREAILAGELWRLLSAHFIHAGWPHLWLNLAGLTLIGLLFPFLSAPRFGVSLLLASALAIDLGLWLLNPEIHWYVGLSGVLHGLFAGGALLHLRHRGWRGGGYLLLLAVKLAWEQTGGPLPGSAAVAGARVITEAHLYGAAGGAALALFLPLPNEPAEEEAASA